MGDVNWQAVGTVAGAGAGFMIGGPVGAMAGASIGGGLGGLIGAESYNPQAYNPNPYAFAPTGEEAAFTQALQARAQGTGGPSAAELQMQRGFDQASRQAMGLAAAQRGINPALAARLAADQQAALQVQGVQQTGIMRAQEALGAEQLLAQTFESQANRRIAEQQLRAGQQAQINQLRTQQAEGQRQRANNLIAAGGQAAILGATGGAGGAAAAAPGAAAAAGGPGGTSYLGTDYSGLGNPAFMNQGGMVLSDELSHFAKQVGAMAAQNISGSGVVPGKPKVKGDSPKNDVVPAVLSPGEMVIPRSIVSKGPNAVAAFAQAVMGV